jgi:glycosyltransferase involved in cell wall biosynthesis
MNDGASFHGRPLRVLHGTYEIAGQGMMLARGLRENGCDARSFSYRVDWDGRVSDIVVDLDAKRGLLRRGLTMAGAFARWSRAFDVYHLHFGTSFLPRLLDVRWLSAQNRCVVFHFHGCEVRDRVTMLKHHALSTCTDCDPFCRPRHQRWLRDQASRYARRTFYSTLDLAESVPGGEHLPLAIESARWTAASDRNPLPDFDRRDGVNGPVVIGHAPTNRLIKGTRHVVAAVEALRREFPRMELRMIDRRPWAEMPDFLAGCDILVDQLHMGWYGLLAIEGMAERKAVVAHLRDDFRPQAPDLPVVDATPATITRVLRELIRDPVRRRALGVSGEAYVRREHDTAAVGAKLLSIYRRALAAPDPRPLPHGDAA